MMEIPARHPRKGDCIIREQTHGSGRAMVLVDYPLLTLTRRPEYLDELVDRTSGQPITLAIPTPVPAEKPTPRAASAWHHARQTLLALRLGQSTPESVTDFSVGMEQVDRACTWALERAATGQLSFLLFESPYGMGKSHALAHLRWRAHAARMAAGTVVLDGVGVSLCQPMSLLSGLAHAIEFPDGNIGDGLPQRLARRAGHGLNITRAKFLHELLMAVPANIAIDPDHWARIEDYLALDASRADLRKELGINAPAIRALRRDDRPARCAQLIREWANACIVLEAPGGLVVLLDEADVDYAQAGFTHAEREQRRSLLEALCAIASAGSSADGYARLVIAIALTPGPRCDNPIAELKLELGPHLQTVILRELTAAELRNLGERVGRLYGAAYQLPDAAEVRTTQVLEECTCAMEREPGGRNPRTFIRRLLEMLDVAHA
jgi:hypothetical protein